MSVGPGTRLGPYEILAPLGAGGMGVVFRARDTRLRREVAVKVLPDSVAGDARALARFEMEARALAALSHPAILALHDIGREGNVVYVVTELLEGLKKSSAARPFAQSHPWLKGCFREPSTATGFSFSTVTTIPQPWSHMRQRVVT